MILHICPRAAWTAAQAAGVYEGDTLATQGYIHCSTEELVHVPATLRLSEVFRVEHRHDDGSWVPMEEREHNEAEHDAERAWLRRRVFACTSCDEQVAVTYAPDEIEPPTP